MSGRRLQKWDSTLAKECLDRATGADLKLVVLLNKIKGGYRLPSMVRRILVINNMKEQARDLQMANLELNESQFKTLHKFCQSVSAASWRPYTPEEKAMHFASSQFQFLKRSRKPLEWVWKIGFLPKEERAHTACVIWWDMFADRLVSDRFEAFDQWLVGFKQNQCISSEALRKNLIACGYPELVANRRVAGDEFEPDLEEETV